MSVSLETFFDNSSIESDGAGAGLVTAVGIVETVVDDTGVPDSPIPAYPDPIAPPPINSFLRSNIFAFPNTTSLTSLKSGSVVSTSCSNIRHFISLQYSNTFQKTYISIELGHCILAS